MGRLRPDGSELHFSLASLIVWCPICPLHPRYGEGATAPRSYLLGRKFDRMPLMMLPTLFRPCLEHGMLRIPSKPPKEPLELWGCEGRQQGRGKEGSRRAGGRGVRSGPRLGLAPGSRQRSFACSAYRGVRWSWALAGLPLPGAPAPSSRHSGRRHRRSARRPRTRMSDEHDQHPRRCHTTHSMTSLGRRAWRGSLWAWGLRGQGRSEPSSRSTVGGGRHSRTLRCSFSNLPLLVTLRPPTFQAFQCSRGRAV